MYFCIICNQYHDESDFIMWKCNPYPYRYGVCRKCDKQNKVTFRDIDMFLNGAEQMSLF